MLQTVSGVRKKIEEMNEETNKETNCNLKGKVKVANGFWGKQSVP